MSNVLERLDASLARWKKPVRELAQSKMNLVLDGVQIAFLIRNGGREERVILDHTLRRQNSSWRKDMAVGALFMVSEACVDFVAFRQMRRRRSGVGTQASGQGLQGHTRYALPTEGFTAPQISPSAGGQASKRHVSAARQDLALVAGYSFRDGLRDWLDGNKVALRNSEVLPQSIHFSKCTQNCLL